MTTARSRTPRRKSAEDGVLLVDIGNTRIKWAWWRGGRLGAMHAAAHKGWTKARYERRVLARRPEGVSRILVACVAGPRVERAFAAAARRATGVDPAFLESARHAARVTTRYREPWRLGVDRFVGAIGAHDLAGRRGVCVVNAGTTVTIDLVDGRGVHLGGVILPGPEVMVGSLVSGTAGIGPRAREAGRASGRTQRKGSPFARSTRDAIWQGALHALAATVERVCSDARARLGRSPLVVLTGGAAARLGPLIRVRHVEVPDLVLRGIAVHGGLAVR